MKGDLGEALREALGGYRIVLLPLGALLVAFLLLPIGVVVAQSFSSGLFFTFPPPGFSTQWFGEVLGSGSWREAFFRSLGAAAVGAVVATAVGTLAAIGLRRLVVGERALRSALLAPLIIPQLVLALGIFIAREDLGLGPSLWTLVLGQTVLALPVVVVIVSAGLAAVDPAFSRASASLGHVWPSTVLRVELPLILRSVVSAFILAFALCFDEAVLAFFLSPPGGATLPTQLWLASTENASPEIAAVSAMVMGMAAVLLVAVACVGRLRRPTKGRPA